MYTTEFLIEFPTNLSNVELSAILHRCLHRLRMNGQIVNREYPIAVIDNSCRVSALVPESGALSDDYANVYVRESFDALTNRGCRITCSYHKDLDDVGVCVCDSIDNLFLFTDYKSLESPVRCGACSLPKPLYRLKAAAEDDEYHSILSWMSDYQACDRLYMNGTTLQRATSTQLFSLNSSLTRSGREICDRMSLLLECPVYYYMQEKSPSNACPSCSRPWEHQSMSNGIRKRCHSCRIVS